MKKATDGSNPIKRLLKKRQLIMATLVLALGAAVFINWYYTKPTVAADGRVIVTTTRAQNAKDVKNGKTDEALGDSQYVANPYNSKSSEYFAGAKLKRNAAHDEAKDTFNAVINDSKANEKAVSAAVRSLENFSKGIKTESDCESLITAKTGSECVVVVDETSAQAILGGEAIDSATALQIKEILMQKTGLPADKITIVELDG
jgi:stage III sporulation protein AH